MSRRSALVGRPFNFAAGPAALPEPVLARAAAEMLDWPDVAGRKSGTSVMEMSHRSEAFISIFDNAARRLRTLMQVPDDFEVLFMQGGAIAENAIVAMNLIGRGGALRSDHVVTGQWSGKTWKEAQRYGNAAIAATNIANHHTELPAPATWLLRADASYVHVCSNETIAGVEMHTLPDLRALGSKAPLVVDCSSHFGSRPVDWSRVGLAYAGAQKNLGPAGLTVVVVRRDLLGHALPICPSAFDYSVVADHGSMYNTPPTYAIYVTGLVLEWMQGQGGIAALEQRNIAKAALLYETIDRSALFENRVAAGCRSRMNVPFFLADARLEATFLDEAHARGLLHLKGHQSVGGLRASLYNAMPLAGVQALVDHMREFEARHG